MTNRQKCFFPEDEAKHQEREAITLFLHRQPDTVFVCCIGGPKDGEHVEVQNPPAPYMHMYEDAYVAARYFTPNEAFPELTVRQHEYKLQKWLTVNDPSVSYTYEYRGLY